MAEGMKIDGISAVFQKQIKALRPGVLAAGKAFGLARTKVKDIAPKVIGLLKKLQGEYADLTFVDFVRMMDSTVPTSAADRDGVAGYRNHPTYTAIRYMSQVMTQRPRGVQGQRDSATDQLARSLATVLQIVKDPAPVWDAIRREFGLEDRGLARLQKRVNGTKPLIDLSAVTKPINVSSAKVIHMEPAKAAQGAASGVRGAGKPGGPSMLTEANLAAMRGTLKGVQAGRRKSA